MTGQPINQSEDSIILLLNCEYISIHQAQVRVVARFFVGALFYCFRSRPDWSGNLENELLKARIIWDGGE